jgi:predicted nucleic acid-binding protein
VNLVDSCGWLEYLADGRNAGFYAQPLGDVKRLVVPAVCVYEVFRKVLAERGEDEALQAAALMRQGLLSPMDGDLALEAARLGLEHKLPMADSMVMATAQRHKAVIWTQDRHFTGLPGVRMPRGRG